MTKEIIHIKNMVCPRCISSVENILQQLNYSYDEVFLGEAVLKEALTTNQRATLKNNLLKQGFELLEDKKDKLVDKVKTLVLELVKNPAKNYSEKLSAYLSKEIGSDYSHISSVFTTSQGITIEKYVILQKIEYVKELLSYNELTLSEISEQLNYSSLAALSAQFKSVTGMTPSTYKQHSAGRKSLDNLIP